MKIIAIAVFSIGAALSVGTAQAQGMMPGQSPPGQRVCLQSNAIESTTTVDASTLLFHMRNGTVWKNTLKTPCLGLTVHGFAYRTWGDEEVCSNSQIIKVIEIGESCQLGAFTPYTGPEQHASIR